MPVPDGPVLLCFDGSSHASQAIEASAGLLADAPALVVTAWHPIESLSGFAMSGGWVSVDVEDVDRTTREAAEQQAADGVEVASRFGISAQPRAVRADGPLWQGLCALADEVDARLIVVGSRGLSGIQHLLLGSVSEGLTRHASQPVLVVHGDTAAD